MPAPAADVDADEQAALDAVESVAARRRDLTDAIEYRDRVIAAWAKRSGMTPGQIARRTGMSTSNVRIITDRAKWAASR